jgi:hypothetical protein
MILALIGGILLTALSVFVLGCIILSLRESQRAVAQWGATARLPIHPQSNLIIAAWSIALIAGLTLLWFYFR